MIDMETSYDNMGIDIDTSTVGKSGFDIETNTVVE
jgi:hypothetical protein